MEVMVAQKSHVNLARKRAVSPAPMETSRRKSSSSTVVKSLSEKIKVKDSVIKLSVTSVEKAKTLENGKKTLSVTRNVKLTASLSPDQRALAVLERTFNKVCISLENCIMPTEKLHPTPSMKDGIGARLEWYLRRLGCDIIQHAGIILSLPQTAMATAQVLYQRFFYAQSFLRYSYLSMTMACIYLSAKVEECPQRLRDIINVVTVIRQDLSAEPIEPVPVDLFYAETKNQVIKQERRLLKELGFCVHVKHPHKHIVMYLQLLEMDQDKAFMQKAWNYMNDSLRTDLFVRYSPEAVACGCIFLAARALQIALPRKPSWIVLFNVSADALKDIAMNILLLYSIKLLSIPEVETEMKTMKVAMEKARSRGPLAGVRDAEGVRTPDSTQSTPEKIKDENVRERSKEERLSREKRPRDRSDHRKEPKRRRSRTPSPVGRLPRSRTRSPIRRSSLDRKPSPRRSPVRRGNVLFRSRKDDRDRRSSRSRSRESHRRQRSRSRSVDHRSHRDYDRRH